MLRDWVTFYHYPKDHWIHLRTTNPLESIFSEVCFRTDAARRCNHQDNALSLVFKIVERLSGHWHALNGGANLMGPGKDVLSKTVSCNVRKYAYWSPP